MRPGEYEAMFAVEDRHWWYVGLHREIAQRLQRFARDRAQSLQELRILDAGCGTGGLLAHLRRISGSGQREAPSRGQGWTVGVDLAWEGLTRSRSRGLPRLSQGMIEALPFQASVFDVVTSLDVLYHEGVDERRALREMARVLVPGGIVVLQVPAFEWLRSEHDAAIATRRRYTRREVERLLREAGFTVRWSGYRNALLFPVAAPLRLLKRHRRFAQDARSDVAPLPTALNSLLTQIVRLEASLAARAVRFPFGLSVFCVGERPVHPQAYA